MSTTGKSSSFQVSPALAAACIVVVVAILAVVGWRLFRPNAVGSDTGNVPKPATEQQINGVKVPPNVPSYYWSEHKGQNAGQPQSGTGGH